jgi:hypothetical protein
MVGWIMLATSEDFIAEIFSQYSESHYVISLGIFVPGYIEVLAFHYWSCPFMDQGISFDFLALVQFSLQSYLRQCLEIVSQSIVDAGSSYFASFLMNMESKGKFIKVLTKIVKSVRFMIKYS